tara:strand:- start:165 stop:266 length:102 start_codon:yes stop_codon:yes gene_type:complete
MTKEFGGSLRKENRIGVEKNEYVEVDRASVVSY